jgi:hypothetical protein
MKIVMMPILKKRVPKEAHENNMLTQDGKVTRTNRLMGVLERFSF